MTKRIARRTFDTPPEGYLNELHPTLRRIYRARGVQSSEELDLGLKGLLPPEGLLGLPEAIELLQQALKSGTLIVIVGDYDADGATASALAVRALRRFGAQRVDYLVPDRFTDGYGLSPGIVDQAADRGAGLIVTVDNGIASIRGVSRARELGMACIVTDHHLPGEELPAADAIVNPSQKQDRFPSKNLAGVGVIFYLLTALRSSLRDAGWFEGQGIAAPNMADFTDLVALGTVADLVRLDRNNRILVGQGLKRIRAGRCCAGILALLQMAGREPRRVIASDMGFSVGPRLNAAGRLDDMGRGIECLLSDDSRQAMEHALALDALNRNRQTIESEMKAQADVLMEQLSLVGEGLPMGLCLFDERWHQGVVGILASRLKERYHRPVVAMAQADETMVRGSARSIPGLHIRDVLADLDSRNPGLLERFGGHAMAAGMSLGRDKVEVFRRAFEEEVQHRLGGKLPAAEVVTDGTLGADELNMDTARVLRYAGPWGQGFPEPLFDGEFQVLTRRFVGEVHLKFLLAHAESGLEFDAIAFRWGDRALPGERVRLAYRLDLNEFRGVENAQLVIEHLEDA